MPAIASEKPAIADHQPAAEPDAPEAAAVVASGESSARGRRGWRRLRPRWTLRLRLTLLYGSLFLLASAMLLGITYFVVARATGVSQVLVARAPGSLLLPTSLPPAAGKLFYARTTGATVTAGGKSPPPAGGTVTAAGRSVTTPSGVFSATQLDAIVQINARYREVATTAANKLVARAKVQLRQQRADQLSTMLIVSSAALGLMALVSIGLGWWMAGRALRPVRTINARVRGISERNLHERVALQGPHDELKELGDTFDGLLGRLESAFESQRRFVANASHELRTPLTLERTLVDVALADPNPSVASLRRTCERVRVASEQQERLIGSLLTLARSQRGLASREEIDLAEVTGAVLQAAPTNGIAVERELEHAETLGDGGLLERLATNLIDNAIHHNEPEGWIRVWTGIRNGRAVLRVCNSGPVVPGDQLARLVEPFTRLCGDRTNGHSGQGLGLSIVGAIATAHEAQLAAAPNPGGGLTVEVRFPRT